MMRCGSNHRASPRPPPSLPTPHTHTHNRPWELWRSYLVAWPERALEEIRTFVSELVNWRLFAFTDSIGKVLFVCDWVNGGLGEVVGSSSVFKKERLQRLCFWSPVRCVVVRSCLTQRVCTLSLARPGSETDFVSYQVSGSRITQGTALRLPTLCSLMFITWNFDTTLWLLLLGWGSFEL